MKAICILTIIFLCSRAMFTFVDGTEVDVEHTGTTDCDDDKYFVAKVFDEISTFRTMTIDKIHMYGSDSSDELIIDQGNYFRDAFNCCIF